MWTYQFEENGGYDCMYDAFEIKENGKRIFVIDQGDFGQSGNGETGGIIIPEAELYAKMIVNAMNRI